MIDELTDGNNNSTTTRIESIALWFYTIVIILVFNTFLSTCTGFVDKIISLKCLTTMMIINNTIQNYSSIVFVVHCLPRFFHLSNSYEIILNLILGTFTKLYFKIFRFFMCEFCVELIDLK